MIIQDELLKAKQTASRLQESHQERELALQHSHNLTERNLEAQLQKQEKLLRMVSDLEKERVRYVCWLCFQLIDHDQDELLKIKDAVSLLQDVNVEYELSLQQEKEDHRLTGDDLKAQCQEQERLLQVVSNLERERVRHDNYRCRHITDSWPFRTSFLRSRK